LFILQPLACGESKEPIEIITTTNYCQGTTTASDSKVKPGDIALSHDIEKKHKLKFGDLIYLEGENEPYIFTDRMPGQWARRADLYSRSCKTAIEYGVRKRMVWFVRKK
jgi:3D (Asp-Asp-Asp) domain-containing protein